MGNQVVTEAPPSSQSSAAPRRKRWKRLTRRTVIILIVLSVLGSSFVGVAEYHTAQPDFCGSCHNMVPYYESWSVDLHGAKLDVACVECHYAPGERTTVKAKLRGLSQLASYFGGRKAVTRPRAHVTDSSCLTSKCHGDLSFMDKPLKLGTVEFTHAKHLRRPKDSDAAAETRLKEIQQVIRQAVGDEHFTELEETALIAGPAAERYDRLVSLCRNWHADVERQQLIEFSTLLHRPVRIAQLDDLTCANCHAYAAPANGDKGEVKHHFRVHLTSCYTCHFNNEGFNVGTNSCQLCHELPQQEIIVHEPLAKADSEQLASASLQGQTIRMNHKEIVERNVACYSCHADVIRNDASVTRRDCEQCHDQPRFFADWQEQLTVAQVAKLHSEHVDMQRAKCLDCHQEIDHQLLKKADSPAEFLAHSVSNCLHCHPNHHTEQIKLLTGTGGHGVLKSAPNPMFGSHTNCYGCHTEESLSAEAGTVVKASQKTCAACHGDRYAEMFDQWKAGVEFTLEDAETTFREARKQIEENTEATEAQKARALELLRIAEEDLRLVKLGNGIHNVTYAIELLDSVSAHSQSALEALTAEE
ncbi:MAG: NapC/NirT family cytochrome c [Planctomycetaceae bacterium]|nr:NapC/NirT family cytochrome c [Planctomycetaceae bacterium]